MVGIVIAIIAPYRNLLVFDLGVRRFNHIMLEPIHAVGCSLFGGSPNNTSMITALNSIWSSTGMFESMKSSDAKVIGNLRLLMELLR